MTTMPTTTVKGRLTTFQLLGDSQPYVLDMSAGTTGSDPTTGDFIFIVLDSSGGASTSNTPTPPTGFTQLVTWQAMGTSGSTCYAVYVKRKAAGETNYSIGQSTVGLANKVYAHAFWVDGTNAANVADWLTGTVGTRAGSGGTFDTTAPTMTTTSDNSVVFALGLERTIATETETQLTVSGTGWTKQVAMLGQPSVNGSTITVASKPMATKGATGAVTFTAPNTQATNGAAFQVTIPPLGWETPDTVMPSGVVKGRLTATLNLLDAAPYTVNMSSGTTGTNVAIGDFVFIYLYSSGTTATSNTPTPPTGFTAIAAWQGMAASTSTSWALYVKKRALGDSNYDIPQTNVGRTNRISGFAFWIDGLGAKDVTDWIIGTQGTRAASGGTFDTNAPAITTLLGNTMVLGIGVERTSAAEVDANLTVSGTGWTKQATFISSSAAGGTLTLASKGMVSPGSAGGVTFTSTNTQSTNGVALEIGIPPSGAGAPPPASAAGYLWNGSTVLTGNWYVRGSSSDNLPTSWVGMVHPGYKNVDDMLAQDFFYCSHRGGSRNWPEQSLQGYTQSAIRAYGALEISLARSSDGVWFGLHDASLDRTSLGTGGGSGTTYVASAMTWSAIQTHDMLPAVGAPVTTAHQPYATLDSILDAYLKSHVLFIDPKSATSFRAELIAILKNRPEWQERIVAKAVPGNSNNSFLSLARAEGFRTNAMFYEVDTFATYQAQADILGMEYGASSGTWTSIKSFGKPVMCHVVPNLAAIATGQSKGADGAMVSGVNEIPRAPM
jgi:hypothetical protein